MATDEMKAAEVTVSEKPEAQKITDPCVNLLKVRYSEGYLNSLQMWHRPGQGTVVVNIDSFSPRIPIEILLSMGREGAPGTGEARHLELEARDWLRAGEVTDLLIAYANALQDEDLRTLQRTVGPNVRLWLLSFDRGRSELRERLLAAGWMTFTASSLNPRRNGRQFGGHVTPNIRERIPPKLPSFIPHRRLYERLVVRGMEKVERANCLGLFRLGPQDFDRWVALASADHTGKTCLFRLLGITLKMAALDKPRVVFSDRTPLTNKIPLHIGAWNETGYRQQLAFHQVLAQTGLTWIELSAIDVDQIEGRRGYVSMAGIGFNGHFALRIYAKKIATAQTGDSSWLISDPQSIEWIAPDVEAEIQNPLRVLTDDDPAQLTRLSPKLSELEAILQIARKEYNGENFSYERASKLGPVEQEAISDLVDQQVLASRERRFEISPNLMEIAYRALLRVQ